VEDITDLISSSIAAMAKMIKVVLKYAKNVHVKIYICVT